MTELVVLADAQGNRIGTMPKAEVHHADTPLHLAFSCYVFDPAGRLLVTRRALDKATFPASRPIRCAATRGRRRSCPTPSSAAPPTSSASPLADVRHVLPNYAYRAEFRGVVEHELWPVFAAFVGDGATTVTLDPAEVPSRRVGAVGGLQRRGPRRGRDVSPWSREQVGLLVMLGPDPRHRPVSPLTALPPPPARPSVTTVSVVSPCSTTPPTSAPPRLPCRQTRTPPRGRDRGGGQRLQRRQRRGRAGLRRPRGGRAVRGIRPPPPPATTPPA